VVGTVVWIYDCMVAEQKPGESRRATRKRITNSPELCNRPNLYIADDPSAPPSDGLWVVEVPRPPRPDELKTLPQEVIDNWPKVPKVKVGDRVVITGKFDRRSPRGFSSSDGLLVYGSLAPSKIPFASWAWGPSSTRSSRRRSRPGGTSTR